MKPLPPPIALSPFSYMREPRYSKTDEEMVAIARERSAKRLNAILGVIDDADPIFKQLLQLGPAASSILLVTDQIFNAELQRVHLECAILDENALGGCPPLGLVD